MKKLLSIVLSLLMVVSFIPVVSLSASALNDDTVAVIGDKEFTSLFGDDGALKSAKAGEKVVLVKDVKEQGSVELTESVTLDLAGYSVIAWGSAKVISTTSDIKIISTVEGKGVENTKEKADFGYSGTLVTATKGFTAENINFHAETSFPEYDESVDYAATATYEYKRWRNDSKGKGLGNVDNYTRIANTTPIDVEEGASYYFGYTTTKTDKFSFEIFALSDENTVVQTMSTSLSNAMVTVPTGKNITKLAYNVYCTGNEWGYNPAGTKLLPLLQNGTIDITISKVVKTCAYSGKNNFFNPADDEVEYNLKNCDVTTVNTDTTFTFGKGVKFDIDGVNFNYLSFAADKAGFNINSALASGIIKNTSIAVANGHGVIVNNTSSSGVTFENCTVTCTGDGGKTAMTVNGGLANFVGGTFGNNYATNGTKINDGTVSIDGTNFGGAKGATSVYLASSAAVSIKSAVIKKGATYTVNDNSLLLAALDENVAVYSAKQFTVDTILARERDFSTMAMIYIGKCGHYCQSTQGESKNCAYCLAENAPLDHEYTSIKYNDTQHWYECSRCGGVSVGENHTDVNGKSATCTEQAVCGVCNQKFGTPNGHKFVNYVIDETKGCEHNPIKVATCENCTEKDYDYTFAEEHITVIKPAKDPDCTEDGYTRKTKCSLCEGEVIIEDSIVIPATGHKYGQENVVKQPTYANKGSAYKICSNCNDKYEYELAKKDYPAWASFAILNENSLVETDDQLYANLSGTDGALAKAKQGDTIVLLKNASVTALTEISKEVTVDLMGYTLACDTPEGLIKTTENLNFKSSSTTEGIVTYSSKLIISSATFDAKNINFAPSTTANLFTPTVATAKFTAKNCIIGREISNITDFNNNTAKDASDAKTHGNYVAVNAMATDGPMDSKAFKVYGSNGISGYSDNFTKGYASITLKNSIPATAKALTFKAAVKPDNSNDSVSAHYGLVINGVNYWSGNTKVGVINSTSIEKISVVGKTMYTADGTEKVITYEDIPNITRFLLKPCNDGMSVYVDDITTDATGEASSTVKNGIEFTNAFEYYIEDSLLYGGNFNNTAVYQFKNEELKGTIKNSSIKVKQGIAIRVDSTSADGIVFEHCDVISGGDSGNATLLINGGKVSIIGGSFGNGYSSYTAQLAGGEIAIDGTTFNNAKNNVSLQISSDADISIKSAIIYKGLKGTVNDNSLLVGALADDTAVFGSEAMDADSVYDLSADFASKSTLYIGKCQHWSVTATCTEDGACVFCNKQYKAFDHDYSEFKCDDDNHWKVCSRCGVKEAGSEVAHTFGTAATCTKGTICSVCNLAYGDALGHDFSKTYDSHDDTCHWKSCSRCPAHGDEQKHTVGTVATCTEQAVCGVCNQKYGKANGHEFKNYVSNHDEECHKFGTKTATCENCKETDTVVNEVLLDHVPKTVTGTPATCISSGLTDGKVCELCGDVLSKQVVIPPTGQHTWDTGTITPSNCQHTGNITYTCIHCKVTESVDLDPNLNNHLTLTLDLASTYFATGYSNRKVCKDCGKIVSSGTVVAKKVLAVPKKTKVSGSAGKITVKYKKVTGATAIQVRYKISGKWKVKKFNVKKNCTKTIKKLASGNYSVQVRTMVKQGNLKAFSKWTATKKITVK